MKKIQKLLTILFIFLLCGCTVKNENQVIIDKDGKMIYTIIQTINKEELKKLAAIDEYDISTPTDDQINSISNELLYDEYLSEMDNLKFVQSLEKEKYEDSEYIGYKYIYTVNHIDEISNPDTKEVNITPYIQDESIKNFKLFKKVDNQYEANFIYDIEDTNSEYLTYKLEYTVTLPYPAINNNADEVKNNGKTLTWITDETNYKEINFTFSLQNIPLIKQISITSISIIILLIFLILIIRKRNKKTKILSIFIFLVLSISIGYSSKYFIKTPILKTLQIMSDINKNNLNYDGNTLTIYFEEFNKDAQKVNELINYTSSTDKLYTSTVDTLMKKDKEIKMYDEEKTKILETKMDKKSAQELFGNMIDIENDITLKIVFNTKEENKLANELDLKINREKIIREKIVKTALSQVGKTGYTYWNWYNGQEGFMEWCAAFVSWVGDQHGQIENKNIPKFAWVKVGVDYYKEKGQFKYNKDYTPKPGDIVFFNWNNANDLIDHVGIVEKYENGYVYTIEGNVGGKSSMSRDEKAVVRKVVQRKYEKNSLHLYGYGIPKY